MTRPDVRAAQPARRPPLLVQGLAPAAVAGLLLLTALGGAWPLAVAVLLVQLVLAAGVLAVLRAPDPGGAMLLVAGASVVTVVLAVTGGGRVDGLAGVVALALVAGLLHQLVRRPRDRVTESLGGTALVVVLGSCAACVVALRALPAGEDAVGPALVAVAAALLAGRVGDQLLPRPALTPGATRGWPGLVLALAAGAASAGILAGGSPVGAGRGALLGLAVATAAAIADLTVDLATLDVERARGRSPDRSDLQRGARRAAALRRVALLLPYAAAGPVALLAGRLVLP